jgi:cytochrome c-type biogenesis protein CcmF
MIPELGHFALVLALVVALLQSVLPLWGAARGETRLMNFAASAAWLQLLLIAVAFAALTQAYVTSDFSVANVVANSHSQKPLLYKLSGVWGNHEGSLLLWVLILALFGAAVAAFGGGLPASLKARVLAVQGMIALGFLAFLVLASNPFERVEPPPLDGQDLNPLLQDPGLAFHPPLLYLGYVGFSLVFAFAVAALIEGKVDAAWARWVRPWTLAAWTALTAGIALGSWWAYYELGWGGWWFWDPVENVSFMPWLAGTALLHSALVVEKRDALKVWTVLLAILAFSLSLVGTFIVRSGVLTSVHAFAVDPARGLFILVLLALAIGGALALFAIRAPALRGGELFRPLSREGGLLLNNLLLATAAATVFVGTLYPLFLELATGEKVSVGPPFFDKTFVPLAIPFVLLMGLGPLLAWKRADLWAALQRLWLAALGAIAAVVLLATLQGGPVMAVLFLGLAAWLFLASLSDLAQRLRLFSQPLGASWSRLKGLPRSQLGGILAHAGVALAIAGMTASTAFKEETVVFAAVGESRSVGGYELRFAAVERVAGPNYDADRALLEVSSGGRALDLLTPERRVYRVNGQMTTEAAIRTNGLGDLYVVLGEPQPDGRWTLRLYWEPLVPWIWAGAFVMTLGGLLSLSDRRLRLALVLRRGPPAAQRQPAE